MTIKKTSSIFLLITLLVSPLILTAQDFPAEPVGMVNDFADILSAGEEQNLERKLRNYRDTTTTVIAIASVKSLQGVSINEAATTIFNKWKMWHEDKKNGVLILIAPSERKMRIEVGYGLEGAIPDVMAGRIIRNVLTPTFKEGEFYSGLDRATSIMIDMAEGEFEGNLAEHRNSQGDNTASMIVFILFVIFVIYASSRKGGGKNGRRRRRTMGPGGFIWLGGSSGGGSSFGGGGFGGFSGGGGFGSGGGGASGGW